ncbi:MAG TPA: SRPBCC domain-containing protein [Anaeromyxobacter sp.]
MTAATRKPATDRVTLKRTFQATLEDVWDLWTTKEGIESWWGPDGFAVTVRELDLRPGGELRYAMTAVAPETVAFMKKEGMPTTTELRITFTEVVPRRRLAYLHLADFVPGVAPYDVATIVELAETGSGVHLTLTFDRMHDEEWTKRAVMGWESELGKLERALSAAPRGAKP